MRVLARIRSVAVAVTAGLTLLPPLLGTTAVEAAAASPTAATTTGTAAAEDAHTAGPVTGPAPEVTPATGGNGAPELPGFTGFDPAEVGYRRSEFLLSGRARAYAPAAPLGADGRFAVTPSGEEPYTTRVVVMVPTRPSRFDGTVVVEWFNVSGGADAAPDWLFAHNQVVRDGSAWVGVSAQAVGLDATRAADPARYAALSHPGDSFSYDIFTQAGRAIRAHATTILGGLAPERLLAIGESQSAGRLVTYIDAVHPVAGTYDGFLVHGRMAAGAPLSQLPQPTVLVPSPTPIRDDIDAPVLVVQSETDVSLSDLGARQPDSGTFRLWEIAGTAHFDYYGLGISRTDTGDGQGVARLFASMLDPPAEPSPGFSCDAPVNTGSQALVLDAALHWLDRWVAGHGTPPTAPRLEATGASPVRFATDANGNTRGGVRTPAVDAPVATLGGLPTGGTSWCFLFGTTTPLGEGRLAELYPSHGHFAAAWARATFSALARGFLTPTDAWHLLRAGLDSDIGR